ncbi:MAG: ABC transporter substrate-binding protein [Atopobiaceae bacterium]|nr:ABC transporter substrate-binding protein [Atopobiaceae bacterium]
MKSSLTRREALFTLGTLGLTGMLAACGNNSNTTASEETKQEAAAEDVVVRVAALKGPTAIGLMQMMESTSGIPTGEQAEAPEAAEGSGITYFYTISAAPEEVLPMVIQGKADIALVPSNVGSVLYNKTEGGIQAIDINTLGVLSVVTGDESIKNFADLAGKTIYISGKGSSPEYVLNYLLTEAGIADTVTLEWKDEHSEVAAVLASDPTAVGVLPQPFTTATLIKNEALSAPIDLTDVWNQYVTDGSQFVLATTIVRKDFADQHPAAVADFIKRHAASVEAVNGDPEAAAKLVVQAGIIEAEPVAAKAIPQCNIVCVTGEEMKNALKGYLQVLYDADPASVGGKLPEDDFYYTGESK